jgi:C-terminal processing protease CtpA/Prc
VKLPNGDRFQFAEASYTSVKGKVLEGNGVTPDVEVHGGAAVIEAAEAWILSK